MDQWEHRTILIQRDSSGWAIQYADGTRLEGIDHILDEYGAKGWELVTFLPQTYLTTSGQFGPFDASAYRAVFKRRLVNAEAAQ